MINPGALKTQQTLRGRSVLLLANLRVMERIRHEAAPCGAHEKHIVRAVHPECPPAMSYMRRAVSCFFFSPNVYMSCTFVWFRKTRTKFRGGEIHVWQCRMLRGNAPRMDMWGGIAITALWWKSCISSLWWLRHWK